MTGLTATVLPGGHSEWEPPDPFSNSEVKTLCADASVDFVDVKVGHCQALNLMKTKPSPTQVGEGFFISGGLSCQYPTFKPYGPDHEGGVAGREVGAIGNGPRGGAVCRRTRS